jgi:MFS family permease
MQEIETAQTKTATLPAAEPESSAAAKARRSALLIVFVVMFIDLLGFGIVLPLLPRYGKEFLEPLYPGLENARHRGTILGLLMASFSAMQFVFAPIWGRLSDRVGRRPFLLLGLIGSVVFYALFGFASDWGAAEGHYALGLALLFVARMGAGIAGATVSTAQAVIADCTTPEKRSRGMALIGAAFGIGFTFGPALGALALILIAGHGGPGYVASACSLVGLLLALKVMPETLQRGTQTARRSWLHLHGLRLALQTPTVGTLIATFFCSTLAFACFEPTLALLTQDVLLYDEQRNFWIFAYVGLVLSIAQGGFYQRLAKRGMKEISFMLIGGVLMLVGLGGLGILTPVAAPTPAEQLARYTAALLDPQTGLVPRYVYLISFGHVLLPWSVFWAFLACVTIAVIGFAFVTPSVQALISRRSDPTKQGEILGVNQSANALSRILGPFAGVAFYYLVPSHILPYLFSVVLLGAMLLLALKARYPAAHQPEA